MNRVPGPEPEPVLDSGLQVERTRLAWSRTALSLAVIGALMLHPFGRHLSLHETIPGCVMLIFAGSTWWYGGRRYRTVIAKVRAGRSIASDRRVLAFAWLCLVPPLIGLWAVLS
jgi:uncharacterized membrane protein YidH (DUF202 family)